MTIHEIRARSSMGVHYACVQNLPFTSPTTTLHERFPCEEPRQHRLSMDEGRRMCDFSCGLG
ncbi:MAG: hypothetical protein KDC87_00380 [Planctomycetes bacterium]|nr:hypothetical protein [Planctomycetota bacterium]MCB9871848.1 hypothetical protein [Planctomycetota bacterium]